MRWKCTVAYDGTDFVGWQRQANGLTIQEVIERRMAQHFGSAVTIHGSGRTDSGVHAHGQVFHFDAHWPHPVDVLLKAMRSGLPHSIQLLDLQRVPDDFHARFSATGKCYHYVYHEGDASPFEARYVYATRHIRLDTEHMRAAAAILTGRHDFASFTANPADNRDLTDTVRSVYRLDVLRDGPRITLIAEAEGFLFRMVRSLAGCLYDVGRASLAVTDVAAILQAAKRTERVRTAPARGLFLHRVDYPPLPATTATLPDSSATG